MADAKLQALNPGQVPNPRQALDAEQEVRLTGSVARADAAADESELLVFSLQDFELLRSGADTKPAK